MSLQEYTELIKNQSLYPVVDIEKIIDELFIIQLEFLHDYGVNDIFSNSKFYEIIIANQLDHRPIPGHSGSRDAEDKNGNQFEYKHFKETSSNHSWTFNDYSDNLMSHMKDYKFIFAHINDKDYKYPGIMDWYYEVDGRIIGDYLMQATQSIKNARKMINVSPNQLESLGCKKTYTNLDKAKNYTGLFEKQLVNISCISEKLEQLTKVDKILTSNKLYELLVALKLNHFVNPEQGGREGAHDAIDKDMNTYEYKVYKSRTWNFQDISDAVLNKYYYDKKIILAVVDKTDLKVKEIYAVSPKDAVPKLKEKLQKKIDNLFEKGGILRRRQVSLSFADIKAMPSFEVLYIENENE